MTLPESFEGDPRSRRETEILARISDALEKGEVVGDDATLKAEALTAYNAASKAWKKEYGFGAAKMKANQLERALGKFRAERGKFGRRDRYQVAREDLAPGDAPRPIYINRDKRLQAAKAEVHEMTASQLTSMQSEFEGSIPDQVSESGDSSLSAIVMADKLKDAGLLPSDLTGDKQVACILAIYGDHESENGDGISLAQYVLGQVGTEYGDEKFSQLAERIQMATDYTNVVEEAKEAIGKLGWKHKQKEFLQVINENKGMASVAALGTLVLLFSAFRNKDKIKGSPWIPALGGLSVLGAGLAMYSGYKKSNDPENRRGLEDTLADAGFESNPDNFSLLQMRDTLEDFGVETSSAMESSLQLLGADVGDLMTAYTKGRKDKKMNWTGTGVTSEMRNPGVVQPGPARQAFDKVVQAAYEKSVVENGKPAGAHDKEAIGLKWIEELGIDKLPFGTLLLLMSNDKIDKKKLARTSSSYVAAKESGISYETRADVDARAKRIDNEIRGLMGPDNIPAYAIDVIDGNPVVLIKGYPFFVMEGEDNKGESVYRLKDFYNSSATPLILHRPYATSDTREAVANHATKQIEERFSAAYGQKPSYNKNERRWELRDTTDGSWPSPRSYGGLLNENLEIKAVVGVNTSMPHPVLVLLGESVTRSFPTIDALKASKEDELLKERVKSELNGLFAGAGNIRIEGVFAADGTTELGPEVKSGAVRLKVSYGDSNSTQGVLAYNSGVLDRVNSDVPVVEGMKTRFEARAKQEAREHRLAVEEANPAVDRLKASFAGHSRSTSIVREPWNVIKGVAERLSLAYEGEDDFVLSKEARFEEVIDFAVMEYEFALGKRIESYLVAHPLASPHLISQEIQLIKDDMDSSFWTRLNTYAQEINSELEGLDDPLKRKEELYTEYTPLISVSPYRGNPEYVSFMGRIDTIIDAPDSTDWAGLDSLNWAREDKYLSKKLLSQYANPIPFEPMEDESVPAAAKRNKHKRIYLQYLEFEFKNAIQTAMHRDDFLDERALYEEIAKEMGRTKKWEDVKDVEPSTYTSFTGLHIITSTEVPDGYVESAAIDRFIGKKAKKIRALIEDKFRLHRSDTHPQNQLIDINVNYYRKIMVARAREMGVPLNTDLFDQNIFNPLMSEIALQVAVRDGHELFADGADIDEAMSLLAGMRFVNPKDLPASMASNKWQIDKYGDTSSPTRPEWKDEYTADWVETSEFFVDHMVADYNVETFPGTKADKFFHQIMTIYNEKCNNGIYHDEFVGHTDLDKSPKKYVLDYLLPELYDKIGGIGTYEPGAFWKLFMERSNGDLNGEGLDKIIEELNALIGEDDNPNGIEDYFHWSNIDEVHAGTFAGGASETRQRVKRPEEITRLNRNAVMSKYRGKIRDVVGTVRGFLILPGTSALPWGLREWQTLDNAFLRHAERRFGDIETNNAGLNAAELELVFQDYMPFLEAEAEIVYQEAVAHNVMTSYEGHTIVNDIVDPLFNDWWYNKPRTSPAEKAARIQGYRTALRSSMDSGLESEMDRLGNAAEMAIDELQNEMDLRAWYPDFLQSNAAEWQGVMDDSIEDRVYMLKDTIEGGPGGANLIEFQRQVNLLRSFLIIEKNYVYGPLIKSDENPINGILMVYQARIEDKFMTHWPNALNVRPPIANTSAAIEAYRDDIVVEMDDVLDTREVAMMGHMDNFIKWFDNESDGGETGWFDRESTKWHDSAEYMLRFSGDWDKFFASSVSFRAYHIYDKALSDPDMTADEFEDELESMKPFIKTEWTAIVQPFLESGVDADHGGLALRSALFGEGDFLSGSGLFWKHWPGSNQIEYQEELSDKVADRLRDQGFMEWAQFLGDGLF
jgi:hypothetical protein